MPPKRQRPPPKTNLSNTISQITIAPSPRVDPSTLLVSESEVRDILPPRKKLRATAIAKRITTTLQTSLKQHHDNRQKQKDKLMLGMTEGTTAGSEAAFSLFEASNYDPSSTTARPRVPSNAMASLDTGRSSRSNSFSNRTKNNATTQNRKSRSNSQSRHHPQQHQQHQQQLHQQQLHQQQLHQQQYQQQVQHQLKQQQHQQQPPPEWFANPGSHCTKTQNLLDANSRMIMRLTQALAADGGHHEEGKGPTPEELEATRAVVSQVRDNIDRLVSAVGQAMLTRRDCQLPGEPEMSEDERIIVTLGYATQARGQDMRLRVALLQATENLCLASSLSQRKRELYDVLMCLLQRDIEKTSVHDTIVSILTDLISDLQRDKFSVRKYMELASSLPMRPRGMTETTLNSAKLQYMVAHNIPIPPPQRPQPPPPQPPYLQANNQATNAASPQSPMMAVHNSNDMYGQSIVQPMVFEETKNPLHIHIRMTTAALLQLQTHIQADTKLREQVMQQRAMQNQLKKQQQQMLQQHQQQQQQQQQQHQLQLQQLKLKLQQQQQQEVLQRQQQLQQETPSVEVHVEAEGKKD